MTRTLADMTHAEREACIGRWATYHGSTSPRPVIIWAVEDDLAWRISFTSKFELLGTGLGQITPRLDLPRAWTPDGNPVTGDWEEKIYSNSVGDYTQTTRQRRYITDWEVAP